MNDDLQEIAESPYKIEMKKAWDCYYNDQVDSCMEICQALIMEYPVKSGCHYLLAHVFRIKELYRQSVEELEIALVNDDGSNAGYIYYWLGEIYGKSGWMGDEEKYIYDKEKSEQSYSEAKKCENYPPDLLFIRDYDLSGQERIETYELGISKFADLADFYVKLAKHYGDVGLSDLQIQTFHRALDKKISSASLFYNIGYFHRNNENLSLAAKYFGDALVENKEYTGYNFAINYVLGRTAEMSSDFNLAEKYYRTAYSEEKDHNDKMFGFLGLISIYMLTNDHSKLYELILNLDVNLDLLTDGDSLNGCPARFSRLESDHLRFEGLAELYKLFTKLKPPVGKDLLNGKFWLVRYFMACNLSKYSDQHKAILNARKFLSIFQFDFLDDLHTKALRNLLFNKTGNLREVTTFYGILVKDLDGDYDLQPFIVKHVRSIVNNLFDQKLFGNIAEFAKHFSVDDLNDSDTLFKMAYSCADSKNFQKGKELYQQYLQLHGESSAVLNNLGLLFAKDNKYAEAIELYNRGLKIAPDDDHLKRNLKTALKESAAEAERSNREENLRREHLTSINLLKSENDWVLDKLLQFVGEVKKDEGFDNWEVPLAKYKFQKYLNVDKQRAESLMTQWLNKGYLKDTGYRHDYNVVIYAVNPFIEDEIKRVQKRKIPQEWINAFVNISVDALDASGYFFMMDRMAKIGKKFRVLLERDFNELTYNYLIGHHKATIVLSGSLVELALIYYCERKKLTSISWNDAKGNPKTKKLYDCVLHELIEHVEQSKVFGADFVHLSNLSRIYRNFVHPGKELKSSLDKSKADLCFLSTSEILKSIL